MTTNRALTNVSAAVFGALLFALLGWLLAGYFTRPLRQIAEAADRLSSVLRAGAELSLDPTHENREVRDEAFQEPLEVRREPCPGAQSRRPLRAFIGRR